MTVAWRDVLGLWQGSPSCERGCVVEEVFMASRKEREGVASALRGPHRPLQDMLLMNSFLSPSLHFWMAASSAMVLWTSTQAFSIQTLEGI